MHFQTCYVVSLNNSCCCRRFFREGLGRERRGEEGRERGFGGDFDLCSAWFFITSSFPLNPQLNTVLHLLWVSVSFLFSSSFGPRRGEKTDGQVNEDAWHHCSAVVINHLLINWESHERDLLLWCNSKSEIRIRPTVNSPGTAHTNTWSTNHKAATWWTQTRWRGWDDLLQSEEKHQKSLGQVHLKWPRMKI